MDRNDFLFYNPCKETKPTGFQWNSATELTPNPPANAALFSGQNFNGNWGNVGKNGIVSIPTEAYQVLINLKSANPPPGVEKQLSQNRPGNNFTVLRTDFGKYA